MLTIITETAIDSKTSTPMEPTIIDSLLDLIDLAEFDDGWAASEWVDVNGTTGQAELLLPVDVLNEEQPERYLCVHVHRMVYQLIILSYE